MMITQSSNSKSTKLCLNKVEKQIGRSSKRGESVDTSKLGEWVEEEEGKWKEESEGHLFLTRDSQMQSEKQSSLQNLEQQPKAHKSRTFFAPNWKQHKRVNKKSKIFYVR